MAKRDPKRNRSSIVPRAVFATAVVAVVPACAKNAGPGSGAGSAPVANVASDVRVTVDVGVDAGAQPGTRTMDVLTGDASSDVTTPRDAAGPHDAATTVTTDAGNTTIDAGAPRRRARPVPVSHPGPPFDRHRFYGVARSTFENDPRNRNAME